jgi:DNA-damage-inducible protein J
MTQINVRMDDNIKLEADRLFTQLGISMSAAINMFVHQAVKEGGIPFHVTTKPDPFYSKSNMKVLLESIAEANQGKLTPHELID